MLYQPKSIDCEPQASRYSPKRITTTTSMTSNMTMNPAAVSPTSDDDDLRRHKSLKNRQTSVYVSRVKPGIPPFPTHRISDTTPDQIPSFDLASLPISPRWDSLSNGTHLLSHSPTTGTFPVDLDIPQVPPLPASYASSEVTSNPRDSSRSFASDVASSSGPLSAKASQSDLRHESTLVENFSRPRKPSIKQPLSDPNGNGGGGGSVRTTNMIPPDLARELAVSLPQTPPWNRSRGPSMSSLKSTQSTSTFASPHASTMFDSTESRMRQWNTSHPPAVPVSAASTSISATTAAPATVSPTPASAPVRLTLNTTTNRAESAQSAPVGGATGSGIPWTGSDELRSSYRSQLTASTTPETTERSSVITKDSSVSSVYATADTEPAEPEEPSLEDVMGMYEKGFADDTDEEVNDSDSDEQHSSRPATAISETGPIRRTIDVTNNSKSIPTIPEVTQKQLDAEIRQSKMIFTSLDFISTLPAISSINDDDTLSIVREVDDDIDDDVDNVDYADSMTKRDSTKSASSDPFAISLPSEPDHSSLPSPTSSTPSRDSYPDVALPPAPTSNPAPTSYPTPTSASSPTSNPAPPPTSYPTPTSTPSANPSSTAEDPGSRDRYGFKKQNQHITREQYDEWNKGYSPYLSRRRKKWVAYLKDSALMTDRPIRFPAPNAKTKRFVRKGIPPDWRGAAWFYYAGGPAILGKNSGLYVKLLQKPAKEIDAEAIERDLHRTFPDNIQFKMAANSMDNKVGNERHSQATLTGTNAEAGDFGPKGQPGEPPIITSLRRVLHAFSVYNPKIGYCQSLNFLAGLLLLFVETEENCFWLLNVITHIYLPGTHEMSLEGSKVDLGVLMTEIRDTMPEVWEKIGGELEGELATRPAPSKSIRMPLGRPRHRSNQSVSTERLPPITLCMTAWFMSCFIGTLPIETTLRVWDIFFYEGSKTLFRVAMAIFKQGESEIRAVSDPMEMFGVVQTMPRKMLDANGLMELCFKRRNGFNHLNQEVIDGRRRERRDKARREQKEKAPGSGYATEVEPEVVTEAPRRRATLFGKKRRDFSRPRLMEA